MFVTIAGKWLKSILLQIARSRRRMEEEDQQFDNSFDDEDYGEFDDMYGSSDEDQDEVVDYEDMKSALEMIQQVCS